MSRPGGAVIALKLRLRFASLALGTLMGALTDAAPGRAETRAVVVGIDNYKYISRLRGAENDARDIASSLARRGVTDIVPLTSGTASRAAVLEALDDMVARTQPGDLVVIAFAGHGATERWGAVRPPDARPGEEYTVFLMPDFEPPALNGRPPQRGVFGERILGREMNARLTQLERKGARTVFLADTCYGGGMTRAVPPEAEAAMSFRVLEAYPPPEGGDDPSAREAAGIAAGDFDHLRSLPGVTFLAAVDRTKKAPELPIPAASGIMRGALSYAFARAMDGEADTDHDGRLTRAELFYYLRSSVRQISSHVQEPELQPIGGGTDALAVIDLKGDLPVPPAPAPDVAPSRQVRIFVEGGAGTLPARGRSREVAVAPAAARAEADLVWNPATRRVSTAAGDLVAEKVSPAGIDAIAEREVARRELVSMARARPLQITLDDGDGARHEGNVVVVRSAVGVPCRSGTAACPPLFYVVINVAGDGSLQYLFPKNSQVHPKFAGSSDAPTLDLASPVLRMQAMPPFGTDTLVMVTSPRPLVGLATALAAMDGRTEPLDVVATLKGFLPADARLATQAIFTGP